MNPYALSGTAPSRRRVYQFHHLGDPLYITELAGVCNTPVGEGGVNGGLQGGREGVRRELPHKNYLRRPTDSEASVGEN